MKHRLPNGNIVLDQFLASWRDLSAAWPVSGSMRAYRKSDAAHTALELATNLWYLSTSNGTMHQWR